jgi:hypothetical protein
MQRILIPKPPLVLCCVLATGASYAQTPFELTALSKDYRVRAQAAQHMMRRLLEIAEGPPPAKEDLEREFRFVYQKAPSYNARNQNHYATGTWPFNPGNTGSYGHYIGPNPEPFYHVSFKFATREQLLGAGYPWFCLDATQLKGHFKPTWTREYQIIQPHSMQAESYVKDLDGYRRSVSTTPAVGDGCATTVSIFFDKLSASSMPNPHPTPSIPNPIPGISK